MAEERDPIERLRARAKGRGKKGCDICGDQIAAYLAIHIKEPNVPRKVREGEPYIATKSGANIIGRSRSYCARHAEEVWDELDAYLDGLSRTQSSRSERLGDVHGLRGND